MHWIFVQFSEYYQILSMLSLFICEYFWHNFSPPSSRCFYIYQHHIHHNIKFSSLASICSVEMEKLLLTQNFTNCSLPFLLTPICFLHLDTKGTVAGPFSCNCVKLFKSATRFLQLTGGCLKEMQFLHFFKSSTNHSSFGLWPPNTLPSSSTLLAISQPNQLSSLHHIILKLKWKIKNSNKVLPNNCAYT